MLGAASGVVVLGMGLQLRQFKTFHARDKLGLLELGYPL